MDTNIREKFIAKMVEILDKEDMPDKEQLSEFLEYALPLLAKEMDKNNELFFTYSTVDALIAHYLQEDKLYNDYIDKVITATDDYLAEETNSNLLAMHIKNMCSSAKKYMAYIYKKEEKEKC